MEEYDFMPLPKIVLKVAGNAFTGHIIGKNPETASKLIEKMPLKGKAQRWGEEIYFYIDLAIPNENAAEEFDEGDIAYWPDGPAIAVFFGKTPVSTGNKPRAYSPASAFAKLDKVEKEKLNAVRDGEEIVLEMASK